MIPEEIHIQLEKIISSQCFSRSDANQRLLKYLTEATLRNENPKEYTIGLEVFNRPAEEAGNSNIRVYIHKLRKKLETYYEEEGTDDRIIFSIPSGSYTIEFSAKRIKKDSKKLWLAALIVLVLINICTVVFFLTRKTQEQKLARHSFWKELLTNQKPTVLVTGNYFFVGKNIPPHGAINMRDTRINNESQLREFIAENELRQEDYKVLDGTTYLPRDALFSMPEIIPVLKSNGVNYNMLVSADFTWEIFKKHNIVYIGSMKNLKALDLLFDKLGLAFDREKDQLIYGSGEQKKRIDSRFSVKNTTDPTVVIKVPGPDGNVIHLFASNHDIGCISSVKFFSDLEKLESFEKSTLTGANYFIAIFQAEGIARTDISFDLLEFQELEADVINTLWH